MDLMPNAQTYDPVMDTDLLRLAQTSLEALKARKQRVEANKIQLTSELNLEEEVKKREEHGKAVTVDEEYEQETLRLKGRIPDQAKKDVLRKRIEEYESKLLFFEAFIKSHNILIQYIKNLDNLLKNELINDPTLDEKVKNGIFILYQNIKPLILTLNSVTYNNLDPDHLYNFIPDTENPNNPIDKDDLVTRGSFRFTGKEKFIIDDGLGNKSKHPFSSSVKIKGIPDSKGQASIRIFSQREDLAPGQGISFRLDMHKAQNSNQEMLTMDLDFPNINLIFPVKNDSRGTSPHDWKDKYPLSDIVKILYQGLGEGLDTYHSDLFYLTKGKEREEFLRIASYCYDSISN